MPPYRPGEVAKLLGVSPSTVKNYALAYTSYLSPGAAVVGQPRYFTDSDVRLLAFVADQSRHGLPRSEILARLDAGELASFDWQAPEDAPQDVTESASDTTPAQVALVLIQRLQNDVDAARLQSAELWERVVAAESRAAHAEGELAALKNTPPRPGFWRRVFG